MESGPVVTEPVTVEKTYFVYHPDELWLKGKNRPDFEKQLVNNLKHQLKMVGVCDFKIVQLHCEILLEAPVQYEAEIRNVSKKVFGISVFARCYRVDRELSLLKSKIHDHIRILLEKGPIPSFKVTTSRVDKRYEINSMDLSKDIGALIFETFSIPVDLKNPSLTVHIEVQTGFFLYSTERNDGAIGLPVGSSGRSVVLLSGGFDSPVAAWSIMRRGCSVDYVHFHSAPYGEWKSSVSKVRMIVKQLATWGGSRKFYSVPIGDLQRQIALKAPEKLRVTLYRRLMVRVALRIANMVKAQSLTTGDNLGQVASQTLESMTVIQAAISPFLICRPLLCDAKQEIIQKAQMIGTKDISILPGGDCCAHMLPKRVVTKPSIEETDKGESELNINEMVEIAIQNMQQININDPWNEESNDSTNQGCPLEFQE